MSSAGQVKKFGLLVLVFGFLFNVGLSEGIEDGFYSFCQDEQILSFSCGPPRLLL